jgi:hypothetical protein
VIFAMRLGVFPPDLEELPEHSSHFCFSLIAFASPRMTNERETKAASETNGKRKPLQKGSLKQSMMVCSPLGATAHVLGQNLLTWEGIYQHLLTANVTA